MRVFVLVIMLCPSAALAHHHAPDDATPARAAAEGVPNPRARARELRLTPAQRALALYLGRTTFNEALDSEPDLAMIWNIARSERESTQAIIDWLRAHSSCVMGVVPQHEAARRPGNCVWARSLMPSGDRPSGWVECQDEDRDGEVDFDCHGRWARVRPRWLAHLFAAIEYVAGEREMIMCPVTPTTWDGRRWREEILARGFVDLGCKYTRNLGLVRESNEELLADLR